MPRRDTVLWIKVMSRWKEGRDGKGEQGSNSGEGTEIRKNILGRENTRTRKLKANEVFGL